MKGLLVVEMIIGYEWLVSGIAKFVRGGFPSRLADELLEKSVGVPSWYSSLWYSSLMKSTVIPYAEVFGYLIEISEVLAGVALLAGPFIWLCAWDRVSDRVRAAVLFFTAAAAIGGTFLAINFHFANGASHPWLIPGDAFDEGIDLDSVLPAIQIVIATVSIILLRRLRGDSADNNYTTEIVMHRSDTAEERAARRPTTSILLALGAAGLLLGVARPAAAQSTKMPTAEKEEAELPHAFFTHMGLPEGVGVFNFRTLGLATRAEGRTDGDFSFHLETGLTRLIGLHIRNDRFLNNDMTEAMFQFAAFVSKDGMSGFAPLIEFEIPTRSGAGSRIHTLVGFTSTLGSQRAVFNQVIHYNPREDGVDGSAALVLKLGRRVFPVVEVLGEGARGAPTVVNLLGGLKVRLREWLHLGLAMQFPLTNAKDFSSQGAFGPDVEWTR